MLLSRSISSSINHRIFQLSVFCIISLCRLEMILPFSLNFIVNLSSSYSLKIAFSSNARLRLLHRLHLLLLRLLGVLLLATTAICYVVTRLRTLLLPWIVVHATAIVMNSKDLSMKSALIFYHVESESSIALHRATPVFVEIWIIRNLQNFSNYNLFHILFHKRYKTV